MTSKLKEYFPMIHEREKLLCTIQSTPSLQAVFNQWEKKEQEEFLDFCTGVRGIKILYDSFFKEVMNPEYVPERLESFLGVVLKRRVKIVEVLPNDSTRISEETSMLITDIVVKLEDGSLANVEIQKVGYTFPGERCACYSADLLLRQYKRVRSSQNETFTYNQIKNVYLIVIYENSPKEFKRYPEQYYHHAKQVFDTGLQLNMLQEFVMIPLDIYHRNVDNKSIETSLEAWLTFLTSDSPDRIVELITQYPEFKPMYETLYQMCQNVEKVMEMFSEELRIMDQNTVKYMIEEQQQELDKKDAEIEEQRLRLKQKDAEIEALRKEIEQMKSV